MSDGDLLSDLCGSTHVATITLNRPPHNFFDEDFIRRLADLGEQLDANPGCRAIVIAAEGKSFCAGANLSSPGKVANPDEPRGAGLYREGIRLFRLSKPIIAAVKGAAIGGGMGLALAADFRIGADNAKLSANFTQLGFHPGFGMTVTLPRIVGETDAAKLMYTGRRIKAPEAAAMGLFDAVVGEDDLLSAAQDLAAEIASSAPLAVQATRATLRAGLADAVEAAMAHELSCQEELRGSDDYKEGVAAAKERRTPVFKGK